MLTPQALQKVDEKMTEIKLPPGYGCIPSAVSAAFKSMKSDEYKTWVLYISLYALKGVLPKTHFNMWQAFVRACKLLLEPYISTQEVETAHELLKLFNNTFVGLIGKEHCTPNMHMQLHIKSCILDFGPVYAFWCYSFERYNGMLGGYHTNNRSITMQLMRKFLDGHAVITSYSKFDTDAPLLQDLNLLHKEDNNLRDIIPVYEFRVKKQLSMSLLTSSHHKFLSVARLHCLPQDDVSIISTFLRRIIPEDESLSVNHLVESYLRIKIGRDIIASSKYRVTDNKNQYIFIYEGDQNRPGFVNNIFDVTVTLSSGVCHIPFLDVSIYREHPFKNHYGVYCPLKLWDTTVETQLFVPAIAVGGKCVIVKGKCVFGRLPLADNRVSKYKSSDVVNFVTEILA